MDSKVPLKIEVEVNLIGNWIPYKLKNPPSIYVRPFVYMDIEIHYDYTE